MGDTVHEESILLIGPPHVGKSRISYLLSDKTKLPLVSLSDKREEHYRALNYDKNYASKLKREAGELAKYKYTKPFEAYHVEKSLDNLDKSAIVAFEPSQTVYEDQTLFDNVFKMIKKFKNIILLLPDVDMLESWQLINKISKIPANSDLSKLNWHLVSSSCNVNLATDIIYTLGKTEEELTDEIINVVEKKKQGEVKVA